MKLEYGTAEYGIVLNNMYRLKIVCGIKLNIIHYCH